MYKGVSLYLKPISILSPSIFNLCTGLSPQKMGRRAPSRFKEGSPV